MRIRPLVRADIPDVCTLASAAFASDEVLNWLCPQLHTYPSDIRRFDLVILRKRLVAVGTHGVVVESTPEDPLWTGANEIIGYAFFTREGEDNKGDPKWRSDAMWKKMERQLLEWEGWYEDMFDRTVDRSREKMLDEAPDLDFADHFAAWWHVDIVGVAPSHQRQGIGALLLRHGQDLAQTDQVPLTLDASRAGRALYQKNGFRQVFHRVIAPQVDQLAMVWEPQGCEGTWLDMSDPSNVQIKEKKPE